jgi:hypothetical protein
MPKTLQMLDISLIMAVPPLSPAWHSPAQNGMKRRGSSCCVCHLIGWINFLFFPISQFDKMR